MTTKKQAKTTAVVRKVGAWTIGKGYIIRTVTMIQVGRLAYIDEHELVLEEAAWVAETKRWADTLRTGEISEAEPFTGSCIVGRGAIVDACEWLHPLLRTQV